MDTIFGSEVVEILLKRETTVNCHIGADNLVDLRECIQSWCTRKILFWWIVNTKGVSKLENLKKKLKHRIIAVHFLLQNWRTFNFKQFCRKWNVFMTVRQERLLKNQFFIIYSLFLFLDRLRVLGSFKAFF